MEKTFLYTSYTQTYRLSKQNCLCSQNKLREIYLSFSYSKEKYMRVLVQLVSTATLSVNYRKNSVDNSKISRKQTTKSNC
jgi:hypothetical protein